MDNSLTEIIDTIYRVFELKQVLDSIEVLLSKEVLNNLKPDKDYQNLLFYMLGKCLVNCREIVLLCANGLPEGALALARNVYEQYMTLGFFVLKRGEPNFEDYVEDYFLDYDLKVNKAFRWEAEKITHSAADFAAVDAGQASINQRKHQKKVSGDYWWTGGNSFRDLVVAIIDHERDDSYKIFIAKLHVIYLRACAAVHAGIFGNVNRLGTEQGFVGIDNSAKIAGQEYPLFLMAGSMIAIVGTVFTEFGIDANEIVSKLNNLALTYLDLLPKKMTQNS